MSESDPANDRRESLSARLGYGCWTGPTGQAKERGASAPLSAAPLSRVPSSAAPGLSEKHLTLFLPPQEPSLRGV